MPHLSGFFMLKPESSVHIDGITEIIDRDNHIVSRRYLIDDYKPFARDMYRISHFDTDRKFFEIVAAGIEVEVQLFGNKALLLMTDGNDEDPLQYLKRLDRTKSRVRKIFSPSKKRLLQAYIDVSGLEAKCSETSAGTPKIVDQDGHALDSYKTNEESGEFVSFYLSYLHTPDIDMEKYARQIEYVNNGALTAVTDSDYRLIKRYKTFNLPS